MFLLLTRFGNGSGNSVMANVRAEESRQFDGADGLDLAMPYVFDKEILLWLTAATEA
jgi:hypothetical protein